MRIFAGLIAIAAACGRATMNLFMMRLHRVDGGFATPHHQTCRMKRAKLVLIFAKKCLLPTRTIASGINQANLWTLHRVIS
jgi:hypothetical protein